MSLARLVPLALLSACSLYYDEEDAPPSPEPDPIPEPGDPNVLARDCIRAFSAGALTYDPPDEIFLTYVCGEGGAIIANVRYEGGLIGENAQANFQDRSNRTVLVDVDDYGPPGVLLVSEHRPEAWVFWRNGGNRVEFLRPFSDITIVDLDQDGQRDFVLAGDNALRVVLDRDPIRWSYPIHETTILSGKPFRYVSVGASRELVYVAGGSGQPVEIGIAKPTTGTTYGVTATRALPDAQVLPLVTRDIDGDMLPDVVGAAPNAFVYSTRYDTFVLSDEPAAGVTAADVDADGVAEVLVLTPDKTVVRRLRFGTAGGALTFVGEPFLDASGDAIGAADLDGDQRADLIMIEDLNLPTSRLRIYPSSTR